MLHVDVRNDEGSCNSLLYNALRLKRFTALTPKLIAITSLYTPERRRVERFLESSFRKAYGARIREHYPVLMSVQDEENTILGAVGFRFAAQQPLFLEQYLDAPVQTVLASTYQQNETGRDEIVEVGNLASVGSGASIFLFTALTAYLSQLHKRYITVTATGSLHSYFERMGMQPRLIGYADKSRLPDRGENWGTYYDTKPRLLTGEIAPALERLQHHLQMRMVESESGWTAQIHKQRN